MKLTSQWPAERVYWRSFPATARSIFDYIAGDADGFRSSGYSMTYDHPGGAFQLEPKRGDITGSLIARAGRRWSNDSELVLTADGQLIEVVEAALVEVDSVANDEFAGSITQLMESGTKRHITIPAVLETFGGWPKVRLVHDGAMTPFPEGQPVTAVLTPVP